MGSDPAPDSPGVFISGITPSYCFTGPFTDLDHDGVRDFCETWFATAFDPELVTSNADYIGREPHWAVVRDEVNSVQIAYLVSYYVDLGTQSQYCTDFWPLNQCNGHYGDSEALYLTIRYDFVSQHWVLIKIVMSQHTGESWYAAGDQGPSSYVTEVEYPTHPGAYPRVYVSYGKHANYPSVNNCNTGFPHLDDCIPPFTYARVGSLGNGNLGSQGFHLLDCVTSTNSFYSSNPPECYWTGARFDGWQGVLPDTDPYEPKLSARGF